MTSAPAAASRRGRPTRREGDTRELLVRAGLETLTEKGFSASGLEEILRRARVPKGSFYHYFASKEEFGLELIDRYRELFARKLDHHLLDAGRSPLQRMRDFVLDASEGMARFDYRRGCLIGNLGQEMSSLPESFRARLQLTFADWQRRTAQCLRAAVAAGEASPAVDPERSAELFWIGWEGAVLRAKLERGPRPLELFAEHFFTQLTALSHP